MTYPQGTKSKKVRCIVWRRVFADIPPQDGYLTAEKPYHEWGPRSEAHLFTLKQAIRIVHWWNDMPNKSATYEVWSYSRA